MAKENYLDISSDLFQQPLYHTQLYFNLMRKLHVENLHDLMDQNTQCYSIDQKKGQSNIEHAQQISNCFDKLRPKVKLTEEHLKKNIDLLEEAKSLYNKKKINCYHIVSESELESCQQSELKSYSLQIRKILEDFQINRLKL